MSEKLVFGWNIYIVAHIFRLQSVFGSSPYMSGCEWLVSMERSWTGSSHYRHDWGWSNFTYQSVFGSIPQTSSCGWKLNGPAIVWLEFLYCRCGSFLLRQQSVFGSSHYRMRPDVNKGRVVILYFSHGIECSVVQIIACELSLKNI